MNYLKEAEIHDRFQSSCKNNYLNNLARKDFAYVTDYNSYFSYIRDFISKYPIFNNVTIIQLNRSAENNYPHTRAKNIICVPSDARFPKLKITLFHEYIHIHQRNNKQLWDSFLAREGWKPYDKNKIPERWTDKIRINPDTIYEQFYIFQDQYIPLPMFLSDYNPKFDEIKIMYYDTKSGMLEHDVPQEFINKYGSSIRQTEHPFEIYACMLELSESLNDKTILNFIS